MKQRKKYWRNNEERESKKEEAYISDVRARNVLTLTYSKIWAISLACAADRRIKKWRLYISSFHQSRALAQVRNEEWPSQTVGILMITTIRTINHCKHYVSHFSNYD